MSSASNSETGSRAFLTLSPRRHILRNHLRDPLRRVLVVVEDKMIETQIARVQIKIVVDERIALFLVLLNDPLCLVSGDLEPFGDRRHQEDTMKIVGHRGASADAPENTLESMKLAWEQGAYAAECDIIRTHDGKLILMHDDSTKRTALDGVDLLVEHTDWTDLKKLDVGSWKGKKWKGVKIPLLEDVLRAIPDGNHLYIEVKSGNTNLGADSRVINDLESIMEKEKISPEKITFICFDHDFLNRLKKRVPRYHVYYLTTYARFFGRWPDVRNEAELETYIREALENGIDGLDMENSAVITGEWVKKIHDKALKVAIWSYGKDDTLENALRYKEIGVDFLTTNMPATILQGLDPSCR